MNDPNIERLEKVILALNAWIIDLAYAQLATQRVLRELSPTMTPEQQKIIRRHHKHKEEMIKEHLINLEDINPQKAALLSKISSAKKYPLRKI
jgi:hypothetical protein